MKNPIDIHDVKPGALITFVYGPGESPLPEFASHKGRAYGIKKSIRFGDSLRVKMEDFTFEYVERLKSVSERGIGAYLPETEATTKAKLSGDRAVLLEALYAIATHPSAIFDGPNASLGNIARAAIKATA